MQTFITIASLLALGAIIGFLISKAILKQKPSDNMTTTNNTSEIIRQAVESEWQAKNSVLTNEYESKISDLKRIHEEDKKNVLSKMEDDFKKKEKESRQDAVNRSRGVVNGKMWEHIIPFMKHEEFPYDPSDARFIGAPLDFIIFDGASENDIKQVIFCEIKTGRSKLTTQENKLRKVVEAGNVIWRTISEADKNFKHIEEAAMKEVMDGLNE